MLGQPSLVICAPCNFPGRVSGHPNVAPTETMAPSCLTDRQYSLPTPVTALLFRSRKGPSSPAPVSKVLRRTHQLPVQRRAAVEAQAFAKSLGLSKPRWLPLPDFGLEKRRTTLGRFFGPIDRQVYEELLEERFKMREQLRDEAGHSRTYGKADWIELMCGCVAPAIPDFKWSAATDGEVDKDGFAIVAVKVSGHHTGAPFAPPGLPPVPAEGRRVALEQQLMRVLVEGGRIREIEVLPSEGAGPLALYKALGGEVSSP